MGCCEFKDCDYDCGASLGECVGCPEGRCVCYGQPDTWGKGTTMEARVLSRSRPGGPVIGMIVRHWTTVHYDPRLHKVVEDATLTAIRLPDKFLGDGDDIAEAVLNVLADRNIAGRTDIRRVYAEGTR
jgi:hypothetical protein